MNTAAPDTTHENNFNHPYYDMDLPRALQLARSVKYGPLPKPTDPLPEVPEALKILKEEIPKAGFNWITGRVAKEVLEAASGKENPFHT